MKEAMTPEQIEHVRRLLQQYGHFDLADTLEDVIAEYDPRPVKTLLHAYLSDKEIL